MAKVLIAEDDHFLANAYRVKLTKAGFEIKMAMDGEETMQILQDFQPDCILLDLVMPKKDGFTVLSEIRAQEKFKNTPILITSNLGQKEDIDKGMAMGANGYIVKSDVSLDNVIDEINLLINSPK